MKNDPVVGSGHLDTAGPRREPRQPAEQSLRLSREVAPDLDERNDLPLGRETRVQSRERIGDTAPFFDWRSERITTVDQVPHQRADNTDRKSTRLNSSH